MADLQAGATGAMTGGGYPDVFRPILDDFRAGRRDAAMARYEKYLPLINFENRQGGLLTCKALMKAAGLIACDAPRSPVAPMTMRCGQG